MGKGRLEIFGKLLRTQSKQSNQLRPGPGNVFRCLGAQGQGIIFGVSVITFHSDYVVHLTSASLSP